MVSIAHLAQRMFNRPLAILPDRPEMIAADLAAQLGIGQLLSGPGRRAMAPPIAADCAISDIAPGSRSGSPG